MAQKTVVIKKYENRRLYDSTNSRYVNLEEVAQLLQQGNDVQVVDAASGEDITRLVLTQIIVEEAKTSESNFPLDLLRQMVVATGRASQESAIQYMKSMFEIYQNAYRAIPNPLNPFEFAQKDRETPEKQSERSRSAEARVPNAKDPENEEVKELRSRLAELEKRVFTMNSANRTGKKRK
jgi:polyhydroxyalkanoate synthesis repressor PhaR